MSFYNKGKKAPFLWGLSVVEMAKMSNGGIIKKEFEEKKIMNKKLEHDEKGNNFFTSLNSFFSC